VNQNLTLVARHRKSLGSRGLSEAEIDLAYKLGALRTWNPDQRIFGLSLDLAGVNPVGPCLGGMYGIAIYAFDPQGKITGAQLKPENLEFRLTHDKITQKYWVNELHRSKYKSQRIKPTVTVVFFA